MITPPVYPRGYRRFIHRRASFHPRYVVNSPPARTGEACRKGDLPGLDVLPKVRGIPAWGERENDMLPIHSLNQ